MSESADPSESVIQTAVDAVHARNSSKPQIALILGSGLGDFADEISDPTVIDSKDIPQYPTSTVSGHSGRLIFGRIASGNRVSPPLLVFQGRVHFYEQGDISSVIFPTHLASKLGATSLIVTNAAGGINPAFRAGDFMLIDDFISLSFLRLPPTSSQRSTDPPIGDRQRSGINFEPEFSRYFADTSKRLGIPLRKGVYCWLKGPSYETSAEIMMLQKLGADAVGMSTVPEIVSAVRLGMGVTGISLISNLATGISQEKLSHKDVTETAGRVKESFTRMMKEVLLQIPERVT